MKSDGFRELIRQAQAGDPPAMDRLLSILRSSLLSCAQDYVGADRAAESASDLVQEAGLRAWKRIGQFKGGPDDEQTLAMFHAWMDRILRRLAIDARRNRSAQRRAPERALINLGAIGGAGSTAGGSIQIAGKEPTPSARLRADESARRVRTAIEALRDPMLSKILELHFYQGEPLIKIGERLGIGYEAVKYRYREAMKRLEHELGDLL